VVRPLTYSIAGIWTRVFGLMLLTGCHAYNAQLIDQGQHAPGAGADGHDAVAANAGRGGSGGAHAGAAGSQAIDGLPVAGGAGDAATVSAAGSSGAAGGGSGGQAADGDEASGGVGAAGVGPEAGSGGNAGHVAADGGAGGVTAGNAAGQAGAAVGGVGGIGGGNGSSGVGAGGATASGAGGVSGSGTSGTGGAGGTGPCMPSLQDCCPADPAKTDPGVCGCGVAEVDSDADGLLDCVDPAPYGWQRLLTIDGSQVPATLTNFPLLVRITDAQLQTAAAASGSDIYFTAADASTLLDFEVESFTAGSGTLVAWVRVPSLSATTDSVVYVGYGDGKSNRSNAAGVWSGYHNVWHLAQDPSLGSAAILDATQRAHGTAQGAMASSALVAGVAGQALSFDGVDDQIAFTNDITGNGPSTLSGWVKQQTDSGDYGSGIVSLGSPSNGQARFLLSLADQQKVKCGFYGNDDLTTSILATGVWKYLVWSWDGSRTSVYIDGVSVLGPTTHNGVNTTGSQGKIGNGTFSFAYFMTGQLDEVRVATAARSSAWISAEFANQRPSSTFIKSVGAAQAAVSH
jgi:hypothetical protein